MKTITLISLFLTLFVGFSCNETITKEDAKDELQTLLTVPISDSFKITDYEVGGGVDLYGYTVTKSNKMRSAIFDPKDFTIRYTYHAR